MSTLTLYEKLLENELTPVQCTAETDFYALWQERNLGELPPIEQALVGGALASSLAWVFTAGYQATLRNAFNDLPKIGWAAFAATEDQREPEKHPGTSLIRTDEAYVLNGYKSWVAHSQVVDTLIVTINDPAGDKYKARGAIIARESSGVHLSHRENPDFLKRLSQGFAHFDNTAIQAEQLIQFESIRQFGRTEAKFVMLACVAFMLTHSQKKPELARRLLCVGSSIEALLREQETSRKAYAAVDLEFQTGVDCFEDELDLERVENYSNDKRLLRMYSERIQRKAKRKKV